MRKLALGVLGALVAGGIAGGVVTWLDTRSEDDRLESIVADARQLYQSQAGQQANIDSLFEHCSPGWVKATAKNNVDTLVEFSDNIGADYLLIQDSDALTGEAESHLRDFCDNGDADSYCQALADSVEAHAVGGVDAIGGKDSLISGCLERYKSDVAVTLDAEVGDCFVESGAGWVKASCSDRGALETIAIWEIPDATLPSLTALDDYASRYCPARMDLYLVPTDETWALGDRLLVCLTER